MEWIFHIAEHADWEQARVAGQYRAASLATDGFIHCSTRAQVIETANRYYRGRSGLVLLCLDKSLLGAALRYEAPAPPAGSDARVVPRQELFPQVYAAIDIAAVAQTHALTANTSGEFAWPEELAHLT